MNASFKLILWAVFATCVHAATIATYSASASAFLGPNCFKSSAGLNASGKGSLSCFSQGKDAFATISISVTADSIGASGFDNNAAGADATGKVLRDDLYSVQAMGQVFGVFHLVCQFSSLPTGATADYSIAGSALTSCVFNPRGGLGTDRIITVPFLVNAGAAEVTSAISLSLGTTDTGSRSADISLPFQGFQDAAGNPIASALIPEPGTLSTLLAGICVLAGFRKRR